MSAPDSAPNVNAAIEFDVEKVRADFPILSRTVYDTPLVYLDNAATSQKPQVVIDAMSEYYERENANIHRGVHALSVRSTEAFEAAREKARAFVNAPDVNEIVFVRGTTEGINLVAHSFGALRVREGDEVLISALEHHSDIVPWQLLCERAGAKLKVIPIDRNGDLILEEYQKLLTDRTRIVGLTYISNALGTVNPVRELIVMAHERGIPVLVDAAQAAPHVPLDVQKLDADFLVFSGHKVFAPTGVGILYGRKELLDAMPPYQGGGDMIETVTFEKTTYAPTPSKFEAGTPNIAGAIGLGAAIDYVNEIGMERVAAYEEDLIAYAAKSVGDMDGVRLIGTPKVRAGVVSFLIDGVHPHDVGTILDREGVAIRAGHHCSQPVMDFYGVPATCRASFALYNTRHDVDRLVAGIKRVQEVFR